MPLSNCKCLVMSEGNKQHSNGSQKMKVSDFGYDDVMEDGYEDGFDVMEVGSEDKIETETLPVEEITESDQDMHTIQSSVPNSSGISNTCVVLDKVIEYVRMLEHQIKTQPIPQVPQMGEMIPRFYGNRAMHPVPAIPQVAQMGASMPCFYGTQPAMYHVPVPQVPQVGVMMPCVYGTQPRYPVHVPQVGVGMEFGMYPTAPPGFVAPPAYGYPVPRELPVRPPPSNCPTTISEYGMDYESGDGEVNSGA